MQPNTEVEVKSSRGLCSRFFSFIASPFTNCCKKKTVSVRPEIGEYESVAGRESTRAHNMLYQNNGADPSFERGPLCIFPYEMQGSNLSQSVHSDDLKDFFLLQKLRYGEQDTQKLINNNRKVGMHNASRMPQKDNPMKCYL